MTNEGRTLHERYVIGAGRSVTGSRPRRHSRENITSAATSACDAVQLGTTSKGRVHGPSEADCFRDAFGGKRLEPRPVDPRGALEANGHCVCVQRSCPPPQWTRTRLSVRPPLLPDEGRLPPPARASGQSPSEDGAHRRWTVGRLSPRALRAQPQHPSVAEAGSVSALGSPRRWDGGTLGKGRGFPRDWKVSRCQIPVLTHASENE